MSDANVTKAVQFQFRALLALCFVVAYEATGSLLVPMTMHALFNGAQLLFLYLAARSDLPI